MCYLVREHSAAAQPDAATPPSPDRVRARWAGAVAAALIGGFAIAALEGTAPTPSITETTPAAPVLPVAARSSEMSPAALDKSALPADDGVPTSTDLANARAGDCHHGL